MGREKATKLPLISVIVVSGSTQLNAEVRVNCLWRCVNSLHDKPGAPFELIIVDNSDNRMHREAIQQIRRCYSTVTHVIQNRLNETAGGGYRQGCRIADGQILVTIADDTIYKPGWLPLLIAPLVELPDEKFVAALQKGPGTYAKQIRELALPSGLQCRVYPRAGAYCWAMTRKVYKEYGPWGRKHMADTRLCNKLSAAGFVFVTPFSDRYLSHTNLNYKRPWDYTDRTSSLDSKMEYLERIWSQGDIVIGKPVRPKFRFPLKGGG